MVLVALLALVGGTAGGWFAGHTASEHEVTTSKVTVKRVSDTFSGGSLDVAAVTAQVEPSVVSI